MCGFSLRWNLCTSYRVELDGTRLDRKIERHHHHGEAEALPMLHDDRVPASTVPDVCLAYPRGCDACLPLRSK